MKKSIVIAAILLIGIGFNVIAGDAPACYVKVGDKVYFGEQLKIGLINTKIIKEDGTVYKFPNKQVDSYLKGSKLYMLLPMVDKHYNTTENVMMEYVASRSDLKLFRYYNGEIGKNVSEYQIFKGGEIYLRIDNDNAENILPFFGIIVF